MQVKIKAVTLPDGTPRPDDKYPPRIESVFDLAQLQVRFRMKLDFIRDKDGNKVFGSLLTSPVTAIDYDNADIDRIRVTTKNSVYYLERVMDDAAD